MRTALEEICRTYWTPVYTYIRHHGNVPQDAEDLTQGFFCHLLQKKWFANADPSRGKLRSYLFASLGNFLTSDQLRKSARKRGQSFVHIEFTTAEEAYHTVMADNLTPDLIFQRRWALDALEKAMAATRKLYLDVGPNPLFEALYPRLRDPGDDDATSEEIGARLGTSPSNVRTTLHRMRQSFRQELFQEVGQTIASMDPEEIRAEMRSLIGYL
jgi:RNA polymerase sigma factor (sigma-70 family)